MIVVKVNLDQTFYRCLGFAEILGQILVGLSLGDPIALLDALGVSVANRPYADRILIGIQAQTFPLADLLADGFGYLAHVVPVDIPERAAIRALFKAPAAVRNPG